MSHKRQNILQLFHLFTSAYKKTIHHGRYAVRHGHATSAALHRTLYSRFTVSFTQHAVLLTNGKTTIRHTHFCKSHLNQERRILLHAVQHQKWLGMAQFRAVQRREFKNINKVRYTLHIFYRKRLFQGPCVQALMAPTERVTKLCNMYLDLRHSLRDRKLT